MKIILKQHRYHSNVFDWFRAFQELGHEPELLVYKPDFTEIDDLPDAVYLEQSQLSKWIVKRFDRTRGDGVDTFTPYYFPSLKSLYIFLLQRKATVVIIRPVFTIYSCQLILFSLLLRFKIVFYSQIRICKKVALHKKILLVILLRSMRTLWISPCPGDSERFKPIARGMHFFPFVRKNPLTSRFKYFKEGLINFLVVAKLYPSKNIELAIRAFLRVKDQHENIRLTICAGDNIDCSYYEKLKEIIKSSKHKPSIEFRIAVPFEEMKQVYLNHDVFILSSRYDQAALAPIESMAHGLVTFASSGNGTSKYITDGFDGFLFEKDNEEELFQKINHLLEHPKEISLIGNRALQTIRENHDPLSVINGLLKRLNSK